MKLTPSAAAMGATLFTLFIVSSSGLSIWAAAQDGENRGLHALHASRGQVLLGVDRTVWICDEQGACPGRLTEASGRPFQFDVIRNLNTAPSGEIYVADAPCRCVHVFQPDGRFARTLTLSPPPSDSFEVLPLGTHLVIGDNTEHRLRVADQAGKALKSAFVQYPNGLSRLITAGAPALVLAETGRAKPVAYDQDLNLLPDAIAQASAMVAGLRASPANHELLELTVSDQGKVAVALCRNTAAECSFYLLEDAAPKLLGDLDSLRPERPDLVERDQLSAEIALTSRQTLLVVSPRLTQVYELVDGTPRPFGDERLSRALAELRAVRPKMDRLEAIGRWGALLSSAVLVGLLLLARQTGVISAERAQQRLEAIWRRVVRPDLPAFVALAGSTIAVGTLAAAAALRVAGPGTAAAAAIAAAYCSVRWLGVRLFVARRSAASAANSFALQLGPEAPRPVQLRPGETVEWSAVARLRAGSVPEALAGAAEAAHHRDLLEALLPPLMLVTRTSQRLLLCRCSIVGSALDDVASLELQAKDLEAPPGWLLVEAGGERLSLRLPSGSGTARLGTAVEWLCQECRQPLGSCAHRSTAWWLPLGLGLVFPGLGQLAHRRFGPARTVMLAAIAASLDGLPKLIPQWEGRLPFDPSSWALALVAFFVVAVGALFDVAAHSLVHRRRGQRAGR